jgi:hypothetical protein
MGVALVVLAATAAEGRRGGTHGLGALRTDTTQQLPLLGLRTTSWWWSSEAAMPMDCRMIGTRSEARASSVNAGDAYSTCAPPTAPLPELEGVAASSSSGCRLKSDDASSGGWSGPELRQVSNAEDFPALSLDGGDPFPPFWLINQRAVEMAAAVDRNPNNQYGGPPNCSSGAAPDPSCCSGPPWCCNLADPGPPQSCKSTYCSRPKYGCSEPDNLVVQLVRAREAGIQLVVIDSPDTISGHMQVRPLST